MSNHRGLYIMGISIHGLVRGRDPELGRDADTGGQVKYVVEWARALSANPAVDRVDLLTRRIAGRGIDPSYGEPVERIAEKAYIVRIPFGPRRYLYKESLWPYLDLFSDQALQYVAHLRRSPDLIHGHYADAGYAGSQMARLLGVPFVFTGHSLGRVKRQRLMADGADEHALDVRYRFPLRIEAEEIALDTAALVVASTRQEVEQQYARYDHYEPRRMRVIPPGVDLAQFHPPQDGETPPPVVGRIERFLADPRRPAVLAMARPDERKNFARLIEAFALRPGLRDRANLVLILGCRDDIREMDPASRRVLTGVLALVDRHDLYGSAAYPKRHEAGEVPALYRWAAGLHGVFVNPALTEPFGLTLIEAAASGLPVVATSDGGPRDILAACRNGLLVDPLDPAAIGEAIDGALSDPARWREWSANGIAGAHRHYAWTSHVRSYLEVIESLGATSQNAGAWPIGSRIRLPRIDRLLVTTIDNTLSGDPEGAARLIDVLKQSGDHVGFGVVTGRRPESAMEALAALGCPPPDVLISCLGTEIRYGASLTPDPAWHRHINYQWEPGEVRAAMAGFPGLELQNEAEQRRFKISYRRNGPDAPDRQRIARHLRRQGLRVQVICSHGTFVDLLPIRASPGLAVRAVAFKWGVPLDRVLTAGDSGDDEDMLAGNTLAVVVGGYNPELELLRGRPRVRFADGRYAWGVLEAIDYYNFLGEIRVPEEAERADAP